MRKYLIFILILVCALSAFPIRAQIQNADIVLTLSPNAPRANEKVTASVSSSATKLENAKIAWVLNNQIAIEKVGQKSFSFNVGPAGSKTILAVNIEASDGSIVNKSIMITPADIDLLWEAYNTYTPPFYRGKTLSSVEGSVKVTALPNSSNLGGLAFDWQQDGNNKPDSSGYGKNFYLYKNSYLENTNVINVAVSDLSGNDIGQGSITITPGSPKILFYKKDPIFGIMWKNALPDGSTIDQNGETIIAEPYFMSPKNLNSSDLNYKWSLGGMDIDTPSPKNVLSIKPEAGQSGQSKISLSIDNVKTLFLSISKDLNVNF